MRGNSFDVFTGHLGEIEKAKTVPLSAGISRSKLGKRKQ